jgi:hypothetical protein
VPGRRRRKHRIVAGGGGRKRPIGRPRAFVVRPSGDGGVASEGLGPREDPSALGLQTGGQSGAAVTNRDQPP